MKIYTTLVLLLAYSALLAQNYSGSVIDAVTNQPLNNVQVTLLEDNLKTNTNASGQFTFRGATANAKTLYFIKEGYVFEDVYNQTPSTTIQIRLRAKKKSTATVRWDNYLENCRNYNNPNIPSNPQWNLEFKETELTGDLARNSVFTRRDPSAVIQYNGKYYVWYSRKVTQTSTYFRTNNTNDNVFPWDYTDVYYATSTDGFEWKEEGPAVERGPAGSFDDRSVFTPEVFAHNNKFYLIYQVVKSPYIERVKNNVAMAVADSPNGPWKKLAEPILRPSHNGVWTAGSNSRLDADAKGDFDSHKVHDPCLMFYKDKFYLYYKGERMGEEKFCGEREIRWGVAIADNPEGPYVKSEYNPITNTGHEVSVWNYNDGIAIIQKLDGPEKGSIQFAQDGLNFEMMGTATSVPDALGIFRPDNISGSDPKFGVNWGLSHHLEFSPSANGSTGGWMYLRRFDLTNPNKPEVPENTIVQENSRFEIEAELFNTTGGNFNDANVPFGVNASNTGVNFVNAQDWMEYKVEFTQSGFYTLSYLISAPTDAAEVELQIDGVSVAKTKATNTGGFESYEVVNYTSNIRINAGVHTIRLVASGTADWQWNLDKFTFSNQNAASLSSADFAVSKAKISIDTNPASDYLTIKNIEQAYKYSIVDLTGKIIQSGLVKPSSKINIQNLQSSIYVLLLEDQNSVTKSSLFVKQ